LQRHAHPVHQRQVQVARAAFVVLLVEIVEDAASGRSPPPRPARRMRDER
jgi:hypothetical protein